MHPGKNMSSNPYLAPQAPLDDVRPTTQVPDAILKKVRNGWIVGVVSGVLTLAITLYVMSGHRFLFFNAWSLIDVALIFGLSFGIYRRSRVCAVLMLAYFIGSKIFIYSQTGFPTGGLIMPLIFCYYFVLGVQGTFLYHRWLGTQPGRFQ
jgi:hypothetical protein